MSNRLHFLAKNLLSHLQRLKKDDNGATAVALAILSPALIGGMAIGAESGYWYYTQRKLQHAADVAVHAAGTRKRAGDEGPQLQNAALETAKSSGFKPQFDYSTPNPTLNLTVNDPPASGAFTGRSDSVEVTLFETHPRMLSSIFSKEPVRIGARAVARIMGGSQACVLSLSETSTKAVEVRDSSSATLNGCSLAANSIQSDAYYMPNSKAFLSADCIHTVGGAVINKPSPELLVLKTCSSVQEQAPKTLDPYAEVAEPDFSKEACSSKIITDPISTDADGVRLFCDGLKLVSPNGVVRFSPGLYIIKGGELELTGGEIIGSGVTFFLANNATIKFTGNPKINLSAPTPENATAATSPYIGLLFFGARCDPTFNQLGCEELSTLSGDTNSTIQGAIYLPGSVVEFTGSSGASNPCLQIIADTVKFKGNSTISLGVACGTAGTKPILVNRIVKIVE